jgi:hypothetical protein
VTPIPEAYAARILRAAIDTQQAGALLECLFDGGACALDTDGHLVLATLPQLESSLPTEPIEP